MKAAIWHNAAVKGSGKAWADVFKEQPAQKDFESDNHMALVALLVYPSRCGRRCSGRDPPASLTELPAPKKVGELK
jgi:hypothetical protein